MVCHRYFEARENLSDAYNIYTQLHGKTDAEVVDLLNNLAAACLEVYNDEIFDSKFKSSY